LNRSRSTAIESTRKGTERETHLLLNNGATEVFAIDHSISGIEVSGSAAAKLGPEGGSAELRSGELMSGELGPSLDNLVTEVAAIDDTIGGVQGQGSVGSTSSHNGTGSVEPKLSLGEVAEGLSSLDNWGTKVPSINDTVSRVQCEGAAGSTSNYRPASTIGELLTELALNDCSSGPTNDLV
jgi:hypothetical protein